MSAKTVKATLSPEQAAKLMKGEQIEINLPPDAGKLLLQAEPSELQKIMNRLADVKIK